MFNQYTTGLFRAICKKSEPELKRTANSAVLNFTVVPIGKQDAVPIWYKATVWGALAELLEGNIKHSDVFLISGEVSRNQWGEADAPNYDDILTVRSIQRIQMLPLQAYTKEAAEGGQQTATQKAMGEKVAETQAALRETKYDDIPF